MVDQKIYLDIFAFLRDLETWRRTPAGYFREREKIIFFFLCHPGLDPGSRETATIDDFNPGSLLSQG
jgi:hypothetical protein